MCTESIFSTLHIFSYISEYISREVRGGELRKCLVLKVFDANRTKIRISSYK